MGQSWQRGEDLFHPTYPRDAIREAEGFPHAYLSASAARFSPVTMKDR